ncbi:MAG: hypothetical protein WDM77_14290 [Steroidobacteraceae bacterium]
MSVTGIVAALTAEARTLGPRHPGGINRLADGTLLIISGMGPAAAARASLALVAAGAQGLLSFGLAGALDPGLRAGTVLLPDAVSDEAGTVHATSAPWRGRLAGVAAAGIGGTLLSVAQPLMTAAAKSQAWTSTGAVAVDMESFAIAGVAQATGLRFAVARVVLDTATDSVPASVLEATGTRGEVAPWRLLAGLARRPAEVIALLTLARRYQLAMRSLRSLALQGVGSP